jgi:hypothetical protein
MIVIPEKPKDIKLEVKTADKQVAAKPIEPIVKAVEPQNAAKQPETQAVATQAKGQWQIQLFVSSGRDKAEKTWRDLSAKYAVLASLPHEVEQTSSNNGSPLYRLKAGAFATRDAADRICAEIKDQNGSCWVTNR